MKTDLENLKFENFAGAVFVGDSSMEEKEDRISVDSQKGLLLNFGGIRIPWSSTFNLKLLCLP